jgi:hypothetical protein
VGIVLSDNTMASTLTRHAHRIVRSHNRDCNDADAANGDSCSDGCSDGCTKDWQRRSRRTGCGPSCLWQEVSQVGFWGSAYHAALNFCFLSLLDTSGQSRDEVGNYMLEARSSSPCACVACVFL